MQKMTFSLGLPALTSAQVTKPGARPRCRQPTVLAWLCQSLYQAQPMPPYQQLLSLGHIFHQQDAVFLSTQGHHLGRERFFQRSFFVKLNETMLFSQQFQELVTLFLLLNSCPLQTWASCFSTEVTLPSLAESSNVEILLNAQDQVTLLIIFSQINKYFDNLQKLNRQPAAHIW